MEFENWSTRIKALKSDILDALWTKWIFWSGCVDDRISSRLVPSFASTMTCRSAESKTLARLTHRYIESKGSESLNLVVSCDQSERLDSKNWTTYIWVLVYIIIGVQDALVFLFHAILRFCLVNLIHKHESPWKLFQQENARIYTVDIGLVLRINSEPSELLEAKILLNVFNHLRGTCALWFRSTVAFSLLRSCL